MKFQFSGPTQKFQDSASKYDGQKEIIFKCDSKIMCILFRFNNLFDIFCCIFYKIHLQVWLRNSLILLESRITLFRGLLLLLLLLLTVALCRYVEAKSHGDSGNCSWIRSSR